MQQQFAVSTRKWRLDISFLHMSDMDARRGDKTPGARDAVAGRNSPEEKFGFQPPGWTCLGSVCPEAVPVLSGQIGPV